MDSLYWYHNLEEPNAQGEEWLVRAAKLVDEWVLSESLGVCLRSREECWAGIQGVPQSFLRGCRKRGGGLQGGDTSPGHS